MGELHKQVIKENIKNVQHLINTGSDVNEIDINSHSPLYYAVHNDSYELVKLLVDNKADINFIVEGKSLLQVGNNYVDDINVYLIKNGINLNHTDLNGNVFIHYRLRPNILELAIKYGANVNIRNNFGTTPLMEQTTFDNIKLLVDAGANVNATDNKGNTILHNHFMRSNLLDVDTIEYIIKQGFDITLQNHKQQNILQIFTNVFTTIEKPSKTILSVNEYMKRFYIWEKLCILKSSESIETVQNMARLLKINFTSITPRQDLCQKIMDKIYTNTTTSTQPTRNSIVEHTTQTLANYIKKDKWLSEYFKGNYQQKDKYYHHMPIGSERLLNMYAKYSGPDIELFRGYSFENLDEARNWLNREVREISNSDTILLKTSGMTSWSSDYIVSKQFAQNGQYGIVLSKKFSKDDWKNLWDVRRLSHLTHEFEFFVKSGVYKCHIEDVYKDEIQPIKSIHSWKE
ncbi:hypothetical protein SAGO17_0027 [Mimivirus AB-566-O17]|uniref:Uncharacterized protein n=1 Tax=Mimivirus AB-566-O17 TaxID=1988039 RepID=A0A1X9VNQ2_9VIRU|nr:hypothetical protein SAGO17_0027 [Mimivirus AB-566-O17]